MPAVPLATTPVKKLPTPVAKKAIVSQPVNLKPMGNTVAITTKAQNPFTQKKGLVVRTQQSGGMASAPAFWQSKGLLSDSGYLNKPLWATASYLDGMDGLGVMSAPDFNERMGANEANEISKIKSNSSSRYAWQKYWADMSPEQQNTFQKAKPALVAAITGNVGGSGVTTATVAQQLRSEDTKNLIQAGQALRDSRKGGSSDDASGGGFSFPAIFSPSSGSSRPAWLVPAIIGGVAVVGVAAFFLLRKKA